MESIEGNGQGFIVSYEALSNSRVINISLLKKKNAKNEFAF